MSKTNTSYVKTNKHAALDARLKPPNTYKLLKPNPAKLINATLPNNYTKDKRCNKVKKIK